MLTSDPLHLLGKLPWFSWGATTQGLVHSSLQPLAMQAKTSAGVGRVQDRCRHAHTGSSRRPVSHTGNSAASTHAPRLCAPEAQYLAPQPQSQMHTPLQVGVPASYAHVFPTYTRVHPCVFPSYTQGPPQPPAASPLTNTAADVIDVHKPLRAAAGAPSSSVWGVACRQGGAGQ